MAQPELNMKVGTIPSKMKDDKLDLGTYLQEKDHITTFGDPTYDTFTVRGYLRSYAHNVGHLSIELEDNTHKDITARFFGTEDKHVEQAKLYENKHVEVTFNTKNHTLIDIMKWYE